MAMRIFVLVALLGSVGIAGAQNLRFDDRPKLLVPKTAPTRQDLEQRDALKKYVLALTLIHDEKYADAMKLLEESAQLDPNAPAVFRAQTPILIGMRRYSDALASCGKVVALDPGDYRSWYSLAKLSKTLAKYPEAIAAMESGLKAAELKDHPEVAQQMLFELGGLYESVDRPGRAADAYSKAAVILEHPEAIEAKGDFPREAILARAAEMHERIGQLYRQAKQYGPSLEAMRKAQTLAPDRAARLSLQMAQIADEQGDLKTSLGHLDLYLRTRPLSADPYDMRVSLLRRLQRPDLIVPWVEQVAAGERHNNALQALLAREYVTAKLNEKAEPIYRKLLEDTPSAEYYRGLFTIYNDEGPAGTARILAMLNKAIDKTTREAGPTPIGNAQHARAMVAAVRDDGDLARKLVDVAFRQAKTNPELKFDTVYFLAVIADRHRKLNEAEQFYRDCLRKTDPSTEQIIYAGLLRVLSKAKKHQAVIDLCKQGLASAKATNPLLFYSEYPRALAALQRYDEALTQADEGARLAGDGNRLLFQMLRLRILSTAERFDVAEREALALIKAAVRPADIIELRYVLSGIYSGAKQNAKSEEQLHFILKIDPDNATVNNDLGYLWADQSRNLEDAERMVRLALDLDRRQRRNNPNVSSEADKDNAAYVDSLGWVLFRRGQIESSRKELERAAVLDGGEDPVIYDHLGDVYYRLEMRPEAARAWQRSLDLYDQGLRRKDDERLRDLRRKLGLVK
ncbi:MAG: tetratricopeptide repeat protein [Gemmataceae bacterium]|nr:tetratricopeptide repeat protein [Gemmataceae bacterium]